MIYVTYAFLAVASLFVNALAYILAPVLPLFAKDSYGWLDNHTSEGIGPRLPTWLNVFMTPDNSLDGDSTFQSINGTGYWAKVKWLWRNPAYSFGLRYLTAPYAVTVRGDNTIKDNDNAKEGWCLVHANGLFQCVYIRRINSTGRCLYVNLGWNIRALADVNNQAQSVYTYQATFVFSPRLSGFR